jgi:tetratricopeptide (TPR) repeat protein
MSTTYFREYIDKDHAVMDRYYDLCELSDEKKIKRELIKLINQDEYFFDSYTFLAQILESEGKEAESIKLIDDGYTKSLELILDKSGNWPDRMEWGWLENRHIIRIILNKGINEWTCGNKDQALDIFRNLLSSNPNDNAGVRFYILAVKIGLSFDEYEERFESDDHRGMDVWDWFNENVEKYPEEFKEWVSLTKEH